MKKKSTIVATIDEKNLIKLVAKEIEDTGGKIDESTVSGVLYAMAEVVTRNIMKGYGVKIPGLAYASTIYVKKRNFYDVRTKRTEPKEAHYRARFKTLKELKYKVRYGCEVLDEDDEEDDDE